MAKTKISEYSATANSNTDVASINIDEGCAPSGINNAIRAVMGHLKDFQSGTSNDPFTVGSSGSLTLSYGTANGVAHLNGSKVLTTGSALTFDGTYFGVGSGNASIKIGANGANNFQIYNGALTQDGTNYAFAQNYTGANTQINAASGGQVLLQIAGNTKATLDSSGNIGLGVTPSAWKSTWAAFQLGNRSLARSNSGAGDLTMVFNGYFDTTDSRWEFQNSGDYAARYSITGAGVHSWYTSTGAGANANDPITFTQAMTLDASGNLGIGQTTVGASLDIYRDTSSGSGVLYPNIKLNNNNSTGYLGIYFYQGATQKAGFELKNDVGALTIYTGSTERARIDSSGNLQVSNLAGTGNRAIYSTSTGILTNSSSDRKLKENDAPISQGLDAVLAMRPVSFEWIDKEKMGSQREIGFIAQDMQTLVPEVVGSNSDETLSIDYPKLVAVMAKAIQELSAKIDALENK